MYDFETEPEQTRQIKCSECNNWKSVKEHELEYMQENDIPDSDFVCKKCKQQEHLI